MGQLKSDGRAIDVTGPAGTINFGDLYRIDGWNGIAMDTIASGDTVRELALEVSSERIWYVKTPSGIGVAKGAYLYWAAPGSFQVGETNLQATAATTGDPVACKVEQVRNSNGYAAVRVIN